MSLLEAILLGIVQGLTEFLPISSSGHLILVPWAQDYTYLRDHASFNKTFDVALHLGTLIAVVSYFRDDLRRMLVGWFRTLGKRSVDTADERLAWVVVVATIPAVIAGGLGSSLIEDKLGEPWMIAVLLIGFALVLALADRRPETRDASGVRVKEGLFLGFAQSLALAPGVSRSGVTISAARFLGLDRDAAARVSFLMLVPATLAAVALEGFEAVRDGLPDGVAGPMVAGTVASATSGYLAIAGLLRYVRTHTYDGFVVYRVIVGLLVLGVIATGLREATF